MTHSHDASQIVAAFVAAFNARDTENLDRVYADGAVLVPAPGQPLTGDARVSANKHLLSFGVPIEATVRHAYVAGDTALLIVDWSIRGTTHDGHDIDLAGTATDVARRGADGTWRYVIDNPYGTA